jgi:hypothetical protein
VGPDLDPHGFALILIVWFLIQVGKMALKKGTNVLFEVLAVLFCGLEASPEAWTSFLEA